MKLSTDEVKRYSRHLVLQEFGLENQLKLKKSKVLVVGAGGLGSPALLYLAAAGIGTIGIADFDRVDVSNLQRQVLFDINAVGRNKAQAAKERLSLLNPEINFEIYTEKLTSLNALAIVQQYDVVLDGTDNFPTRYLMNDACVLANKPLVYGSILRFEGQVAVFNYRKTDGSYSANYRDLFASPPDPASVPNCEQAGVLGVLPGMIGSMQASEVIKVITGLGEPLYDKLLLFDSLSMQQTIIGLPRGNSRNSIQKLIDYDEFCGLSLGANKNDMKEVTVQELKELIDSKADFQLIDVREPHEFDICNLEGELIPQAEIPSNVDRISKDKKVVIHCRSGARSGNMVQWLEKNHGFTNLYNLKGGILAWAREIDPTMPSY
ncbi:molybdopterin-synthase adenylyltransferase MoeB [Pseudochryseolinea flava]|uniref:Molybdopterin-synthase adenylyltransferase n=1 Tax=Pseudochryseolinea flava TaxID=2059302 RepID=A0A364Y5W9_9BACT|nr:molybdopterin-synthase adenylyltransferase MoeB [Pseudochryseolinea flava]RAW01227.1 molybdenum cofactor biosynthesis protein MoeB [Pseudochryseolinea flava]